MEPIPGAQAGVARLSQIGDIAYYTARLAGYSGQDQARKEIIQTLNERMAEATRQWLAEYQFPCPHAVVCCDGPTGKLVKIAALTEDVGDVILIDDLYTELLVVDLDEQLQQKLCTMLTLIAFGSKAVPDTARFPTISLPTWSDIDDILPIWKGVSCYAS
jgi:hypothetical protein